MIILASQSPRRRDLCAQIGLEPVTILPTEADESPKQTELARMYAERMALQKAEVAVQALGKEHANLAYPLVVIAADTVVNIGRDILHKTDDAALAEQYLTRLSGRRHRVYGALVVAIAQTPEMGWAFRQRLSMTKVHFRRLAKSDIAAYLATEEWRGCAGGYAIQGQAAQWVKQIQGSYTNVVGMNLYLLRQLLKGVKL